MNLSGDLADWPVADLLNMLKVTNKTVTLQVRSERTGTVHFSEGRVCGASIAGDAVVEGEDGSRVATVDALFVMSSFDYGKFELTAYAGPEGAAGWEIDDLLHDMERLNELISDLETGDLSVGSLMLKDAISGPVTVAEDDWWALASLVSVLSLEQLQEVFGRARAVRLLHTLWRLDLIEAIPDSSEETAEQDSEPPAAPVAQDAGAGAGAGAGASDEAWLDQIAAKQADDVDVAVALEEERKRLTGVAAPASTVLTGSVLDEMRRLRSRVGE